jgi:excisionase family DNA binding protein
MDERIWFNTTQAAAYGDRHPVTVRRALEAGVLHGGQTKAGGRWRIHRDCLDAWLLGIVCPHAARKSA